MAPLFLDTYRTMCIAPDPDVQRIFEHVRRLTVAA